MSKFALAATFLEAEQRLSAPEASAVTTFVIDFSRDPKRPGFQWERVKEAKSPNIWAARVNRDLRVIARHEGEDYWLLFVAHHDDAYNWTRNRTIDTNNCTNLLQIVLTDEVVREEVRTIVRANIQAAPLFAERSDSYLLSIGVPDHYLPALREVRGDEDLLRLTESLPPDVADALFSVADGKLVTPKKALFEETISTISPETRRSFYVVSDEDELRRVLEAPLEKWLAFLHPTQVEVVEREFHGPALVTGAAGTGKTVVAMHRARSLARQGCTVLLTTFSSTLAANVERNLKLLCSDEERRRIVVGTVHSRAREVVRAAEPGAEVAGKEFFPQVLAAARAKLGDAAGPYDETFLVAEWNEVIGAQGITSLDEYRKARRSGRGKALPVRERERIWPIFDAALDAGRAQRRYSFSGLCQRAAELLRAGEAKSRFDAVIVDEVQDLKSPELRFVAALAAEHPGRLMLAGDAGQRIYPGGFSLRSLGIEVRGRSHALRVNYRTTAQIRRVADRLFQGNDAEDEEEIVAARSKTRDVLRGPEPVFAGRRNRTDEDAYVVEGAKRFVAEGVRPGMIGVFAYTNNRAAAVKGALEQAGVPCRLLQEGGAYDDEAVQIGTMHRAKGLEFRVVFLVDVSRGTLPNERLLANCGDAEDRADEEDRERRLLYVAMTRARDQLFITWMGQPSPFLAEVNPSA